MTYKVLNFLRLKLFLFNSFESEVAQSRPTLFDPWTVAHQVLPSMGFSRQQYWNGLTFPSPGDLPSPGIEPRSPTLQADALPSEPRGKQKQDWELTVAQIINSLLPNSDFN